MDLACLAHACTLSNYNDFFSALNYRRLGPVSREPLPPTSRFRLLCSFLTNFSLSLANVCVL